MKSSAINILQTLHNHGFTALFVGGCVRDMLMGKEPGDYDIVTDASILSALTFLFIAHAAAHLFAHCVAEFSIRHRPHW